MNATNLRQVQFDSVEPSDQPRVLVKRLQSSNEHCRSRPLLSGLTWLLSGDVHSYPNTNFAFNPRYVDYKSIELDNSPFKITDQIGYLDDWQTKCHGCCLGTSIWTVLTTLPSEQDDFATEPSSWVSKTEQSQSLLTQFVNFEISSWFWLRFRVG